MRRPSLRVLPPFLVAVGIVAACGDALTLNPAVVPNRVDTVPLWAVHGTPVFRPSAYIITSRSSARTDQVNTFDFVYDIDPTGLRVFLPLGALINTGRTSGDPGFRGVTEAFDSITVAAQTGYFTKDTVPIHLGDVLLVRSTVDPNCGLGIPYYAKLQILAFDDAERAVRFQILSDINCGYRGLQVGLPKK